MKRTIHQFFPLIFIVTALAATGCGKRADKSGSGPSPDVSQTGASGTVAKHRAALEVHAAMTIDLADGVDPSDASRRLAQLAESKGGYVEASSTEGTTAESVSAHVVLRIPASEIDGVRVLLTTMRRSGTATTESLSAKDVGDALADLDARLRAAREEEARLLKLLDEKTGALGDVIAVEKTLAEVRENIERLEAEQRVSQGRVDLATIDVWLRAPMAEPTVARQISIAARDGGRILGDAAVATITFSLRFGPTLLFFLTLGLAPWLAFKRMRRQRPASSA